MFKENLNNFSYLDFLFLCFHWLRQKLANNRECRIAEKGVCIEKVESLDRMKTLIHNFDIMKKYVKAQMVAKNLASGSYAAGCGAQDRGAFGDHRDCRNCERAM